jgi:hypothetical protein
MLQSWFKASAGFIGAGFWWVIQTFWGNRIQQWLVQKSPDWLQNPLAHMTSYSPIIDYGPPIFLIALGLFFAFKGYREGASGYTGLDVLPSRGQQAIIGVVGSRSHDEVTLTFTNKSGNTLRISNPKLKETALFPVPPDAVKNIVDGYRELKFINQQGIYVDHERILKNLESATTGIAVRHPMDDSFYSHQSRKIFGPKYFRLRFTVLQGDKTTQVDMRY